MKAKMILMAAMAMAAVMSWGAVVGNLQDFVLGFDHGEKLNVRAFTNGVFYRGFLSNEVMAVSGGSWKVNVPGVPRGVTNITLTVVDGEGVESDPAVPLVLQVKPGSPGNLRKL